jgi:hypothetical protein
MAYLSLWERLGDAIERVVSEAGVSKNEAQTDLCRAIADGAVKIQAKLREHATKHMTSSKTVLEGGAFQIPPRIGPKDFDWEMSRPLKPWTVRRGHFSPHGPWDLELIEVMMEDVTRALRLPEEVLVGSAHSSKKTARSKSRPAFDRASRTINKLYPPGVPDQATVPNKILCQRVAEQLKEDGLGQVSDDTILRAAGRRK